MARTEQRLAELVIQFTSTPQVVALRRVSVLVHKHFAIEL